MICGFAHKLVYYLCLITKMQEICTRDNPSAMYSKSRTTNKNIIFKSSQRLRNDTIAQINQL